MLIVSLFLNNAITMPRPTAASATATVITNMAKTWPSRDWNRSPKATRFRFAVEEERKRARKRAEFDAKFGEYLDRVHRVGRIAFHKMRKAASPDEKHELIAELARQFDVTDAAIVECARQYRKPFLAKVARRRAARIWRLHGEGLHDRDIADHNLVRVHITTVRNVLGKRKRKRR